MRKKLNTIKAVPFQNITFLRVFFLFVLRLRPILQQDFLTYEYIFCVIRCDHCTKGISSCKYVVSSYSVPIKMNLNDTTPCFQEVGGVTNPLISYKL